MVDGTISKVKFNDYVYSNIIAHGVFRNKLFSGSASINDPNIKIDTLVGSINFSKSNPQLAVNAKVNQLNLRSLHFTNDSISVTGKFDLNFTGNNIDNFLGTAKLFDAELYDGGQHLSFDSLIVSSAVVNNKKLLTINTNEIDATINGQFKIMELPVAFQLLLSKYYPAYIDRPKTKIANEDFTFLVKTRFVSNYVNLFDKEIQGLDNSIFIGSININANTLNLQADVPQFKYSQFTFNNIHVSAIGNSDTLVLNTNIDDVIINDSLHSPDTKIRVVAANDVSDVTIKTSANRTLTAADLSARVLTFEKGFKLTFNHSTFTINQKQWDIEKDGEIELKNKMILASKIKFSQNGQEVFVSTHPSEINNSNDLIIAAQNLIIQDFTPFFMKTLKVSGLFNGNIKVSDPFGKISAEFDTRLTAFKLENDSIGVITAGGEYNGFTKNLKINAISDNKLYNFSAALLLQPADSTKPLSGSIVFNHTSIHILENYLNDIFSNIQGSASGTLSVSGKMASPVITGSVSLDSTALTVDYTQCRYHLADKSVVTFNPDEIDFGSIQLIDTLFNTATLSGKIYHNFFDNFFFNELHLNTDQKGIGPSKFLLLNTTAKDNSEFYGRAIGRASLSLNGFVTDLKMNISGEITDSSHIYLPTGETAETGSIDYIEFIKFGREMKPDLKSRESTNIKVDMEILANPLAKIDVILDETTGDVIKAQGTGKLNISAGTNDLNKFISNAASAANIKLTSDEREIITCKKRQLVYSDGKNPFAVHYIVSGKIKTYKETEFGKELITGIYTEGDFIGYTTVLEDTTYSDTAEALEDAELMLIPKEDFLQLINTDAHVSKMFIKLLTKNVLENEEKLIAIAYQSLRKKVALGIIEVLDKFKIEAGSKREFIISRQDLSHVMGIATESLVRTLADFKVEKLIELKEGKIIILEESRLRNFQY